MKKLVVFPSDPIEAYIKEGLTYDYLEDYYNPGSFFDVVYSLSLWGEAEYRRGKMIYRKCSMKELNGEIRKINPDVIRAYGGYISSDLAQLSKERGIPIVVSVHDTSPDFIHNSLAYADYIICMTEAVKKVVLSEIRFDEKKIWVMPNRINENVMKKVYDKEIFEDLDTRFPGKKHILHVGRKSVEKNLDTVIKAMTYLDDDVVSIFVGRGDVTKFKELAQENGVLERCFFVESVRNDELPYWYSWCDCFCTPSRREGFGFVFIEAAACEAPIVTSNIAPLNEYLTNGENAILVNDYENPQRIAEAISRVFTDDQQIKKMCSNAREVGLNFTKDKIDMQEIEIYKNIMSKSVNSKMAPLIKRKIWELKYVKQR